MTPSNQAPVTRGHRKKERTRQQLLTAGMRVLRANGDRFAARDVTSEAELSSGTFYNYFGDTDELIDAITREELLQISSGAGGDHIADPALRIAVTATKILRRAGEDEGWARLVLRLVHRIDEPNQLNRHVREALAEGHEDGRFTRGPDDLTLDQATGLMVMTIRRIVGGAGDVDLVPDAVARILEGFGIAEDEAPQLAEEAGTR